MLSVVETERAVSIDDDMLTPVVEETSERTPTNVDINMDPVVGCDYVEGMDDHVPMSDSEDSSTERHTAG